MTKLTKKEALREFRSYMADIRADARREGLKPDRHLTEHHWGNFIDFWLEEPKTIDEETASAWRRSGPR